MKSIDYSPTHPDRKPQRNAIGHKLSGAAAMRSGEALSVAKYDEIASVYREWLVFGFPTA